MKKRDADKNLEVICAGRAITDQGEARGKREAGRAGRTMVPGERAKVEPTDQQAKVE